MKQIMLVLAFMLVWSGAWADTPPHFLTNDQLVSGQPGSPAQRYDLFRYPGKKLLLKGAWHEGRSMLYHKDYFWGANMAVDTVLTATDGKHILVTLQEPRYSFIGWEAAIGYSVSLVLAYIIAILFTALCNFILIGIAKLFAKGFLEKIPDLWDYTMQGLTLILYWSAALLSGWATAYMIEGVILASAFTIFILRDRHTYGKLIKMAYKAMQLKYNKLTIA